MHDEQGLGAAECSGSGLGRFAVDRQRPVASFDAVESERLGYFGRFSVVIRFPGFGVAKETLLFVKLGPHRGPIGTQFQDLAELYDASSTTSRITSG